MSQAYTKVQQKLYCKSSHILTQPSNNVCLQKHQPDVDGEIHVSINTVRRCYISNRLSMTADDISQNLAALRFW